MLEQLKSEVCKANLKLVNHGLVTLTWGNVSGYDPQSKLVAIKPSGVDYDELSPEHIVIVNLDGEIVEGNLRPSSDTPTHILLYQHFSGLGGITHTHSTHATMFAQAREEIPCLGTTHADHFMGSVPVSRPLTQDEVQFDYEGKTGQVIVDCFDQIEPLEIPAVLVAGHAPFTWGESAGESVKNAVALEAVAQMALGTKQIKSEPMLLEDYVLDKHYQRKHGPNAYYGQK